MIWTRPEVVLPPSQEYALSIKHKFAAGFEQWYFLQADVHFDSPECTRKQYEKHLKLAKERNALIIDVGDFLDVINGKGDKRGGKGGVRKEDDEIDYLDRVVDHAVEEFEPYADNLVYFGDGNHNLKVLKMYETDLNRRFADALNQRRTAGIAPVYRAGYGGWINFKFEHASGGRYKTVRMKLFHGSGGGGEVTKGTMEGQRMLGSIQNADIIATGHIHESWILNLVQERCNETTGKVEIVERDHVKVGSYKVDYRTDGKGTWHMQRPGGTPKPLGGAWLRFYDCTINSQRTVAWEITRAKVDYSELAA